MSKSNVFIIVEIIEYVPTSVVIQTIIKKETYNDTTKYYPQEKFLYSWYNIFAYEVYFDGGYDTLEEARKRLCDYCREPVVEYLNFDPNEDCK